MNAAARNQHQEECLQLSEILADLDGPQVDGPTDVPVLGITADSRAVRPGYLFLAIRGTQVDGNRFAPEAVASGAGAVLSALDRVAGTSAATWVRVGDDRQVMARVAAAYYGHPSRRLRMVGITGTNGKTTTAALIESILEAAGRTTGLLGTLTYRWPGATHEAARTTPDSVDLHRLLSEMVAAGCTDAVLEVSSHALSLHRVDGLAWEVGVFTNLSRDHLDFHRDMDSYWNTKASLFESMSAESVAVLNLDDPRVAAVRGRTSARVLGFGSSPDADVRPLESSFDFSGCRARLATPAGELQVTSQLPGRHNLQNLIAAVTAGLALEVEPAVITAAIESLQGVPGRFERILCGQPFEVLVDYAHTDDALRNLLRSVRDLSPSRILTVFGCGGERDVDKRPLMGEAAAELSDVVILTSDNPRGEDPEIIADGAEEGIRRAAAGRNLAVLLARAVAEVRPGTVNVATVRHDDWCQGLRGKSILKCRCSPKIQIEPVNHADILAGDS